MILPISQNILLYCCLILDNLSKTKPGVLLNNQLHGYLFVAMLPCCFMTVEEFHIAHLQNNSIVSLLLTL